MDNAGEYYAMKEREAARHLEALRNHDNSNCHPCGLGAWCAVRSRIERDLDLAQYVGD